MSDFISLTCPSCGSKLKITDDIDRLACRSCGNELIVNRGGGIVILKPLEGVGNIQKGVDKTASELAIIRLRDEIDSLQKEMETLTYKRVQINNKPTDFRMIILLLVSTFAFALSFMSITNSQAIFFFLISLGNIFLFFILNKKEKEHKEANIKLADNNILETSKLINDKVRELEMHQAIVKQ